jgi:hypothetical protein
MALGEKYKKGIISNVSWRDWISQDPYFWLTNSFQYSENINIDDELHGIKLSQKADFEEWVCKECQLIQAEWNIFAIPLKGGELKYFNENNWRNPQGTWITIPNDNYVNGVWNGVVFQDYLWYGLNVRWSWDYSGDTWSWLFRVNVTWSWGGVGIPQDHPTYEDEDIANPNTANVQMQTWISSILNYNNTRLVVWVWQYLRVYYPELDASNPESPYYIPWTTFWSSGWKIVQRFEDGCNIIALTCTFQYLKVRVTDRGWNTKVYYYQWNNDLRNTFVYDLVDLTNTKVLRVYPINWIDYYTSSLDWTNWFITFNKLIWKTPVQLFKQRPWLSSYDANQKATYFIGPTSHNAWYVDDAFYIADCYWIWKFLYKSDWLDIGSFKWKTNESWEPVYTTGLAITHNFLFTSDEKWLHKMRLYDTWVDWYQSKWLLISREFEWEEWWCIDKILDEIRLHFELNPLITNSQDAWDIDVYVSPNNLWHNVDPEENSTWWYKVLHIDWTKNNQNRITRFEISNRLNNLNNWNPAFEFDWETITYCVVIKRGSNNAQWTPIVREVNMVYHTKGKTNNIYDLQ